MEKGLPVSIITPDDGSGSELWPELLPELLPEFLIDQPADRNPPVACMAHAELISFAGYANQFHVGLKTRDGSKTLDAGAIIIAEDGLRQANHAAYGLNVTAQSLAISDILLRIQAMPVTPENWSGIRTVVFLLNLSAENHPVMALAVMQAAKTLRSELGCKTYILLGNLKVASDGLEALYQACRDAGVVFVKFTETRPQIVQNVDQSVRIEFMDEITGDPFYLQPDLTVVDERILASPRLKHLARFMRLELDANGFIQADNVHRLPVHTNRKGIFAIGGSRGIPLPGAADTDIANACTGIYRVINSESITPGIKAQINTGQCIKCLTCYRICPYAAVMLNARPELISDLCERCGICAAECPREAITIADLTDQVIGQRIAAYKTGTQTGSSPFLVAFCCGRSAIPAQKLALAAGHPLPANLLTIEVPCAGSISIDYLLSAFSQQADGVLVLTCHEGNCHSERGNRYARQRVDSIAERLAIIGLNPARLQLTTIAANMPTEFAETVTRFEQQIIQLNQVKS
jgi:coenzyme F420-reducing hydrogenase delta subunit/Pyruvate/2-oxoacid:ferredoxin oxidoreductase delta subunit